MRKILFVVFLLLLVGCEKQDVINTTLEPGFDIITVGDNWEYSGCILSLNDEQTYNMAIKENNIANSELGEYEVIYEKEFREEVYTCTRIVKVVDDIAPLVTLNTGIDTVVVGKEWIDSFVTATDNFDLELTITVVGEVDSDTVGRYIVVYEVIDDLLNKTTVTRIVNVIE